MKPSARTTDVVKAGLSITILVTCMLLPVMLIAWAAKWIYGSRR